MSLRKLLAGIAITISSLVGVVHAQTITVLSTNPSPYSGYYISAATSSSSTFSNNLTFLESQPWFTSGSPVIAFAQGAGYWTGDNGTYSPEFIYGYTSSNSKYQSFSYTTAGGITYRDLPTVGFSSSTVFATASGAPEIDGSLAPKVGFLLGCLFLMFGRKKQDSAPMMAA